MLHQTFYYSSSNYEVSLIYEIYRAKEEGYSLEELLEKVKLAWELSEIFDIEIVSILITKHFLEEQNNV